MACGLLVVAIVVYKTRFFSSTKGSGGSRSACVCVCVVKKSNRAGETKRHRKGRKGKNNEEENALLKIVSVRSVSCVSFRLLACLLAVVPSYPIVID